jgi:predicted O-methyltransferase YrrM
MSIEQQLNLKYPIVWSDFAIEEKFANYLINLIFLEKPLNIIELGSGLSTLLILKAAEKIGYTPNFISFDSDEYFLSETKNRLDSESILESSVKLIFSPIVDIDLFDKRYKWYSIHGNNINLDKLDLIVIDGPVGTLCKNSRYPALHFFKKYIKKGTIVILDDANRLDEKEIVELWRKEFLGIVSVKKIDSDRGIIEIKF